MHRALYRKYRPQTFCDVCGQEHISRTLKNQIASGKTSHAYLFTGSRGTGKTSSAKIFAKAVNCLNPKDGDPCGECDMCRGIDSGSVLDVVEIDAASNNGVDNIRELRENIAYPPVSAKYKVYIIDEVHMLSDGAFNALLKTLEEPPSHAIFILATTEVHKIPATILSRCQRYDFSRISADVITDRLRYICEQEGFSYEENALRLIAKLADGGMRDAVSMLDLCSGVSGNVTESGVAKAVGLIDKQYVFDLADMIDRGDTEAVLAEINRLYSASCDMERLCFELISHYRDLMVAKTTPGYRELITATNEELDAIGEQAKRLKFENMMNAVSALSECVRTMKGGTNKRIAIETSLIRLCIPTLSVSLDSLNARLCAVENALKNGVLPTNTASKSSVNDDKSAVSDSAPTEQNNASNQPSRAQGDKAETVPFDRWAEVMEILSETQPMLHAVMDDSCAYVRGDILLIDAPNSMFRSLINGNKRYYAAIREAVMNVSGVKYRIGPYSRPAAVQENEPADKLEQFIEENKDVIVSE